MNEHPTHRGTRHIFTVDVEEYFHAHALGSSISREDWDSLPSRVGAATRTMLDMLEGHGFEATFFILGWVAERHPEIVREIARRGHEVASHGWSHRRIDNLSRREFRQELRDSKELLESLSGQRIVGFRAPSFSLVRGTEWALTVLAEEGFVYDSSIYPIRRVGYGYPGANTTPHLLQTGDEVLVEFPPATLRTFGVNLPAGGGAYFRHLPFALTRTAFNQMEQRRAPGVFYLHTWELDPDQPDVADGWLSRLRHYGHLERMPDRLDRLLDEFDFTSIRSELSDVAAVTRSESVTDGDESSGVRGSGQFDRVRARGD